MLVLLVLGLDGILWWTRSKEAIEWWMCGRGGGAGRARAEPVMVGGSVLAGSVHVTRCTCQMSRVQSFGDAGICVANCFCRFCVPGLWAVLQEVLINCGILFGALLHIDYC